MTAHIGSDMAQEGSVAETSPRQLVAFKRHVAFRTIRGSEER